MTATRSDIENWLKRGQEIDITHLIVVCDTFSWENHPVYVRKSENVREVYEDNNEKKLQRVDEVYSYNHDLDSQLDETRAFHFD